MTMPEETVVVAEGTHQHAHEHCPGCDNGSVSYGPVEGRITAIEETIALQQMAAAVTEEQVAEAETEVAEAEVAEAVTLEMVMARLDAMEARMSEPDPPQVIIAEDGGEAVGEGMAEETASPKPPVPRKSSANPWWK